MELYGDLMTDWPLREVDGDVLIETWVVPGASRSEVTGIYDGKLRIRVSAPAEGGRANREVERLLIRLTGSKVTLIRGMSSRHKVFQVAGTDAETVLRKLPING